MPWCITISISRESTAATENNTVNIEQIFSLLQMPALWIFDSQAVFNTWPLRCTLQGSRSPSHTWEHFRSYSTWWSVAIYVFAVGLHLLLTSSDSQNAFSDFQKRSVMIHFFLYEAIVVRRWQTLIVDFQSGGLFSGIREPWCSFLASAISGRLKQLALIKQDWQPLPKRAEHFPQVHIKKRLN